VGIGKIRGTKNTKNKKKRKKTKKIQKEDSLFYVYLLTIKIGQRRNI